MCIRDRSEIAHDEGNFAISRVLQGNANVLLQLTAEHGLEGIVQKEKSSAYRMGKRSGAWIKVKNVLDEDFLACGYIEKGLQNTSIVLGSIDSPPRYQGHVALGVSREAVKRYSTTLVCPFPSLPAGNENACLLYTSRVGERGVAACVDAFQRKARPDLAHLRLRHAQRVAVHFPFQRRAVLQR